MLPLLLACQPPVSEDTAPNAADADTDTDTDTDTDSDVAHAPGAPVLAFSPVAPPGGVDVSIVIVTESVDPDGDPVTYTYAWTEDGAARSDVTGALVAGAETTDGEVWAVTVTPTDGTNVGEPAAATLTIGNGPPPAPTLTFEPSAPGDGETFALVITAEPDPDGDPITQTVTWYEDGAHNSILDASTTVEGRYVEGGEEFRAVVTFSDGINPEVSAEATLTVTNRPPELGAAYVTPGYPLDDEDMECFASGSDPDGTSLDWSFEWYMNGVIVAEVGDDAVVEASWTTIGEEWLCVATATDGRDAAMVAADAVTIVPFNGTVYRRSFVGVATPDAVTLAGTYSLSLEVHGEAGEESCTLEWDVAGTEESAVCPRCDYRFETTYESTTATVTSGATCAALAADLTGELSFNDESDQFVLYGYASAGYTESVGFTGVGTSDVPSYIGRTYDNHSVYAETDAYGYTTITAYQILGEYLY